MGNNELQNASDVRVDRKNGQVFNENGHEYLELDGGEMFVNQVLSNRQLISNMNIGNVNQ